MSNLLYARYVEYDSYHLQNDTRPNTCYHYTVATGVFTFISGALDVSWYKNTVEHNRGSI